MPITLFGITATKVRDHHFPQIGAFSTATKPTATAVGEMIDEAAADLAGALSQQGLSAADLTQNAYPAAYAWCAKTVRLAAAIAVMRGSSTANPEVAKAWEKELRERYKELEDKGYLALGDAPAPAADEANFVITHLGRHGLDTGDEDNISELEPVFRRDDQI